MVNNKYWHGWQIKNNSRLIQIEIVPFTLPKLMQIAKEHVFIDFSRDCIFLNYFFQCCTQIWLLKFSWAKFRACFCGKGGSFILFIVLLHFLFPVYVTYLSFAKSYSCIVQHAKTQKKRRKMQSHSSHYRKC